MPAVSAVELAQVWVPLMPEASRLAEGVKKIGADAERVFGRATKTMGAQMATAFQANSRKAVDSLRDIEKYTTAAAKAKKADADAAGRLELAEKRLAAVKANAKATDLQRATATEGVARAQRAQELTATNLTKVTKQLESAQKTQAKAQEALKKSSSEVKLPLGARLAEQAERYGADSGSRFAAGFKRTLGAGAALAAGGGFLAAAKQVIDLGVGMESNLNRLKGVTQASASEMANAAAVAKQLGSDTTIVGASAADAAAAMLELAKGGLTMQQALAAAPGTLRLAAAAQIDAATAAESQASILNAFQLDPTQAQRVADALAGVASAAAGEVPDFMQGLQQASAVAHGFGISMEDTVAVLGLFAKAGIRGSDAGTSLKTMLTHLANPSDQASAAMDELGIQAHDLATGEFVGLPKLFEQVSAAAGRMRPDDFQRAAATLFGTDAIRGAMIAGKQGVDTLNQMGDAVRQFGKADELAASNMQGVPGALEKMSNAADSAKLALYDVMKPLLESSGNKAAEWLNTAAEAISGMGNNSAAVDALAGGWRDISSSVTDIAPVMGRVAAQFAQGAAGTVVAGWRALGLAMKVVEPPLKMVVSAFEAIPGLGTAVGAVLGAVYLKSKLAGPALSAAAQATGLWGKAFEGWRTPAKQAVDAMGSVSMATGQAEAAQRGWATRMRDIYRSTAAESGRFSRTLGASKAAMSGLQTAGSGLLGLLGGPWGAAAMGVGAAMSLIAAKHTEAADAARQQREETEQLQATLDKQTGAITEQSLAEVAKRFTDQGTSERAKSYGIDPNLLTQAATGNQQAYSEVMGAATQRGVMPGLEQIKYTGSGGERITWDVLKGQISAAGVTMDELTAALLRQGTAWDDVQAKLSAASGDPAQALQLQELIDRMPDVSESIITMAQNVNEASSQMAAGAENQRLLNETLSGTWKATDEGIARFQALGSSITSVPDGKTVTVDVLSADAEKTLTDVGYRVERLPNGVIKVTADSEEAQRRLADLVTKVETTKAAVSVTILPPTAAQLQAANDAINRGLGSAAVRSANGEVVGHGGRAAGGYVDSRGIINGPGSGRSDSILARVVGGRGGVVRVSNRESINTAASTRRNWPIIDAMNRGWSPSPELLKSLTGMPRFADGGIVDYAESLVGTPYSQSTRWDCSGTIARIVNQATGAGGDLMTTKNAEEWLAARGFLPGMGTSEDFSVGWYDRGPNPGDGHMAATLPGGINAEQGGKNGQFTVGSGAAGADSPQFDRRMHLPADALWPQGSGGGGGGGRGYSSAGAKASAVTKAGNDVAQAERTVAEKQARLDEVKSDAKAKDSQRIKAENDLLKAQEDLAEKKDKLAEARDKPVGSSEDSRTKGPDGAGFGQDMLKGALSALGFDGETFSDPTNWGIFKFGTAAANIFGGVAKNWNWQGYANATDGGADPGKPLRNLGPDPAALGISDGGFGAGLDVMQSALPQVRDFLPPSVGGGSTTNNNHNSNNTTTNSGLNIYGPVTMNQPVQARPPERMNTRMAGLPKP